MESIVVHSLIIDEESRPHLKEWKAARKWRGWKLVTCVLLILYSFLLNFTPSEAFLTPYLIRVKPFTEEQIILDIFPIAIYATLLFTLLAPAASHYFSNLGVIILGALSGVIGYCILYFADTLWMMQINQGFYGITVAARLVFSSYMFIIYSEEDYQAMTSYTQAASLAAFLVASELAQLLVDLGVALEVQVQITITFSTLALFVSFVLPRKSLDPPDDPLLSSEQEEKLQGVWDVLIQTWQGEELRLLSIWWVFGTAGFYMIYNYGLTFFIEIDSTINSFGHIMAASQGAGSLGALAGLLVAPLAARTGGLVYVVGTLASGLLVILMVWSSTIWVAYPAFVTVIGVKELLLCLIYVQCAKALSNREFVLLFSLNTVGGLITQALLQAGVESMRFSMKNQFYVYGSYCVALSAVFWVLCRGKALETSSVKLVKSDEG